MSPNLSATQSLEIPPTQLMPDRATSRLVNLDELGLRVPAVVDSVTAPAHATEWAAWLCELGFLPGEPVQILGRAMPGGDPLMIRIGDSTFALRRAEAACVQVVVANKTPELHLHS